MLDLGWSEMAIIATVALFVIGPKDLPKALRTAGRYGGKVKALAREFQSSIDEAVKEAEKDLHLEEVKKGVQSFKNMDMDSALNATEKLAAPEPRGDESESETVDDGQPEDEEAETRPDVKANKHFAQVGSAGANLKKVETQQPEADPAVSESDEDGASERSRLPLPTGVQQEVEAREKIEANVREEAEGNEGQLDSVTSERRAEPQ